MKAFLDNNFLLDTPTAERLYHEYAKQMPIIDYHCHLPPNEMAADKQFDNLTQIWLYGDHYKWRAMRTNGVNEHFITGGASDYEKYEKWAATIPYTLRNPLYHWSHLELSRYFGVNKLLNPNTAKEVYNTCSEALRTPEFSVRHLIQKMNVEVIGTTDDPTDNLEYHQSIKANGFGVKVAPTFRPDKAILIQNDNFVNYIHQLGEAADITIGNFWDLLEALNRRADFFNDMGCKLSDHGLEQVYATDFTEQDADRIFRKRMEDHVIYEGEALQYQSALLYHLGTMYHARDWTQQFHLGAMRNNSSRMMRMLGPDTGFDSIGDYSQAQALAKFLNRLDDQNRLARTILYNLNPRDNEVMATMIGNFNDGSMAGKMQFGSGWWFLDQLDGMEKQINALSNMGLLSKFVGMLTDSRSFLSFPRHEYFRRLLCNIFGNDVEKGLLPNDVPWIGKLVQDISYYNAKSYFGF